MALKESTKKNSKSKKGSKSIKTSSPVADVNLDSAIREIEAKFGKESISYKGSSSNVIETLDTGVLGLDLAMGGVPKGRIVEIYGPESSGKTTFCLTVGAAYQRAGKKVAFIDAEHALDPVYAGNLGLDIEETLINQPDNGEQALEIADMLVRSNAVDLLIVDSVATLTPRAEIDGEMGDSHMGLQARLMGQALRKLVGNLNKSKTTVIFVNQLRMKIGVMFGNPETTSGGNALKFYASVRLDIRRIGAIKNGDAVIGNRTRVKVVKNKIAPPFKQVEFDIMFGSGICKVGDILDNAVLCGVVDKAGAWFSFESSKIGQGRENSKSFLKEHPEILAKIEVLTREKSKITVTDKDKIKEVREKSLEYDELLKKTREELAKGRAIESTATKIEVAHSSDESKEKDSSKSKETTSSVTKKAEGSGEGEASKVSVSV